MVDPMFAPILEIRQLRNREVKKVALESASFSSKVEQERAQVTVQGTC